MQHAAIIDSLGGYAAVAAALGKPKTTVHAWYQHRIPVKHWPAVLALPAAQAAKITAATLLAPAPAQQPADAA